LASLARIAFKQIHTEACAQGGDVGIFKRATLAVAVVACAFLGGCTTPARNIKAAPVSPAKYLAHACAQLAAEIGDVRDQVFWLESQLDSKARDDVTAVAGAFFLWPFFFTLGGTQEKEAELGRLKGALHALEQAAAAKECPPPTPAHSAPPASTAAPPGAPGDASR
jgi:hypothetical protein